MTTITTRRIRAGRPVCDDFEPRRFLDLDGDHRVSHAEQQDYMPEVGGKPMPVWMAIVVFLVASPLLSALVVHLVRLSLRH